MRRRPATCLVLLPFLPACGGALGPALGAFEEGRLPAAADQLRVLEPDVPRLSSPAQARYALYRGLVELGLGNAALAERWLTVAFHADQRDPRCFDDDEHGALQSARRSMGQLAGESATAVRTAR